jgi:glycerol-3-phosphate acyltransferase PlsY
LKGVDIRTQGSGKTGATNVLRQLGWRAAVATLLGDVAKGVIGVLIARLMLSHAGADALSYGEVLGGLAAIVGHDWPVYIGWRGGRGVATTLGAAIVLSPVAALLALPVALILIAASDMASVGSLLGAVFGLAAFAAQIYLGDLTPIYGIFVALATVLIVFQHRDNIQRLRQGTERRIGIHAKLSRANRR